MDDKAKIPVGEPACSEAATSDMKKVLTKNNVNMKSTDHNYHCVNITPSVNFLCNIPGSVSESFYSGQQYVGLKDSAFPASDPIRHVTQLIHALRSEYTVLEIQFRSVNYTLVARICKSFKHNKPVW